MKTGVPVHFAASALANGPNALICTVPFQLGSAPVICTLSRLGAPTATWAGVASVATAIFAGATLAVNVAASVWVSATASRCALAAAGRLLAAYTRGRVEASVPLRTERLTPSTLDDVSGTLATPFAFVVTFAGTPVAPLAVSVSATPGTAAPDAESTRMLAVTRSPTVLEGTEATMRYGPWKRAASRAIEP